jgi:eukaryotic-like serine/threonine-protein kinase
MREGNFAAMSDTTPGRVGNESIADLSGRQIGDYRLLRRLGRGGMAVVYLAEQQSLGRRVALKILKQTLSNDESFVRRFVHEAKAAAALVHANIVQIHEVGCIDGIHFIAQEYVEGVNLKQLLDRQGALSTAAAVNVIRQVAAALHKAGQAKITHRDIKPENIMLSGTGEVKVADFGLARVETAGESVNLTQIGITMGTPMYMSPEQVQGKPVDTRSDLYSFGVTCYQMLAGRPPFEGDTALKIAVQHLHDEPRRLEDLRPDLPEGLCRIVHKTLAKRQQDRYQNAAELLRDLRLLQIEGPDESWPSSVDWSVPEMLASAGARTEATQQLAAVMQQQTDRTDRSRGYPRVLVIALAGLLLGAAVAWATRPAPLLHVADEEAPVIEAQKTVREQYFHAATIASEAGWRSIARYFPPEQSEENRYYALRAEQRLAELYLENGDLDQALESYSKLTDARVVDPEFRATGLAGLANVYLLRGELSRANQSLVALAQLFAELPREVRQLLINEVNSRLHPELQRLTRELQAEEGSVPAP